MPGRWLLQRRWRCAWRMPAQHGLFAPAACLRPCAPTAEEGRQAIADALQLCEDSRLGSKADVRALRDWAASAWDYLVGAAPGQWPGSPWSGTAPLCCSVVKGLGGDGQCTRATQRIHHSSRQSFGSTGVSSGARWLPASPLCFTPATVRDAVHRCRQWVTTRGHRHTLCEPGLPQGRPAW